VFVIPVAQYEAQQRSIDSPEMERRVGEQNPQLAAEDVRQSMPERGW
jgi:hypothetical protein